MKTGRFTIYRKTREAVGTARCAVPARTAGGTRPIQRLNDSTVQPPRESERGIALIITLILLSVTLVMAIAFLAISRRERGSVTTYADTATAKYAADAALARAEARIVSQILVTTNPYVFSLVVSTNYINQLGFVSGSQSPTNVNYDYYNNDTRPLNGGDMAQNIANLFYDPRPPVFYPSNDFRFYLDLNRNGRFDTNGVVTNIDNAGNGLGFVTTNAVGDPEWIGILEHPDQPHGPNNPFIARYCFIAVPANSLDLNYIHNQALDAGEATVNVPASGVDGYSRDQGVGTWEINLAAFLADLNTNRWDPPSPGAYYQYREGAVNASGFGASIAFDDARALVAWRYNNRYTYPFLASADGLFNGPFGLGDFAFRNGGIDYYSLGQQSTFDTNFYGYGNPGTAPWLGAPLTNDYFSSPSELFNVSQSDLDFVTNLYSGGTNTSTYDRYTFYRMLGQLGTDTLPAQGKINLNYQNAVLFYDQNSADIPGTVATNIAIIPNYETNFFQWRPQDFFTAAANRLLKAYTTEWFESSPSNYMRSYYGLVTNFNVGLITNFSVMAGIGLTNYPYVGITNQIPSFGITNIPVYVNGSFVYTPAVNRLLQLAANIYDSTTNSMTGTTSNYPSVFRPVFWIANEINPVSGLTVTNVYIRGFQYVIEDNNGVPTPQAYSGGFIGSGGLSSQSSIWSTPCEVTDPNLPHGYSATNVWGVPWIIGAKKAFPNFNGFEVDNTFFIERKLQFKRNSVAVEPSGSMFPFGRTYTTNQMYLIGISNSYAMDDWNSYAAAYNNQVTVFGQNLLSVGLTNNEGFAIANQYTNVVGLPIPYWPSGVFVQPFGTNTTVMQNLGPQNPQTPPSTNNLYVYYTNSTPVTFGGYTFSGPCFIPTSLDPNNYLDAGTPALPQFGLVATNHLQAFMVDTAGGSIHILDYVQLGSMNSSLDVNGAISDPDENGLWSTGFYSGSTTPNGVVQQFLTSMNGKVPSEDQDAGGSGGQWTTTPVPGAGTDTSPAAQTAFFSAFFQPGDDAPYGNGYVTNLLYATQAPFTPMREIIQKFVFQANDPLVHYLSSDLNDFVDDTSNRVAITPATVSTNNILSTIGKLSDRYMPWGNLLSPSGPASANGMPGAVNGIPVDNDAYNLSYKDPLVWTSDNWDFPTNKYPTVGWLGRVHRGTPWQSVYLKSPDIFGVTQSSSNGVQNMPKGQETWQVWTGNPNANDAYNEDPLQDRLLFDLFTAAPDDDATRGQVSVNIGADDPNNPLAGLASWSALLSSTMVFSNSEYYLQVSRSRGSESPSPIYSQSWPSYSVWTNQPLGTDPGGVATNFPMGAIVEGINSIRTNFTAVDGLKGVYEHVGDILAVPQLSVASPYLSFDSFRDQAKYGISDEMYEWLPQQMLGLMTVSGTSQSPPRYVIYCYGQTLKPAPNGLVTSVTSGNFGLCTNYQVVAESAARVVLRVENAPTPANPNAQPHVVVEQYNPLPPD